MKEKLFTYLIQMVLSMLNSEMLQQFGDMVLDFIENTVQESENKVDDAMILPLCQMIRTTFNIPDND